jgi:hypothetical protein
MYEDDFAEEEEEQQQQQYVNDKPRTKHQNDHDDQMDVDADLNSLDTFKKQNKITHTRNTIKQANKTCSSSLEKESNELLSMNYYAVYKKNNFNNEYDVFFFFCFCVLDLICEFIEIFINCVLYKTKYYIKNYFDKFQKYKIIVYVSKSKGK